MNDKIDLILEKISSLETGQQELKAGYQKLEAGQQKNYELIQKIGIKVEQIDSNVKGVAEGHGGILNKIDEGNREINRKLDDTNLAVKDISRRLKQHIQQPAHVM